MKLLILVALLVLVSVSALGGLGGMPGGWSDVDVSDSAALRAANFGVFTKYGVQAKIVKVRSVQRQVVRGMNYEVVVEVDFPAKFRPERCTVDKFIIWDDLGTYKLTSHSYLENEKCSE